MRQFALSAAALLLLAAISVAQCQNGFCLPRPQDNLRWVRVPGKPGEWALFRGALQLGNWMPQQKQFWALEGERFLMRPVDPPIAPPAPEPGQDAGGVGAMQLNTKEEGVIPSKISRDDKYSLSGLEVPREKAVEALRKPFTAGGPEDESGKHWLIISGGTLAERSRVREALVNSKELGPLLSRSRLWWEDGADASHWIMRDRKTGAPLYPPGEPHIMLCTAQGEPLHAQAGFDGAAAIDALRRADPNRDPKLDPDLRLRNFPAWGSGQWSLPGVLCVGLVVVLVLAVFSSFMKARS